jgi:PleD family two-component response regulator
MEDLEADIFFGLSNVMYNLYSLNDLDSNDFFSGIVDKLKYGRTGQEIEMFIKALEWAMTHQEYNFQEILPSIRVSNEEILRFMQKFLKVLKSSFDETTLITMRVPSEAGKLRILIVDDSQPGDLIPRLAGKTNDVSIAADPESAIQKYSRETFDIILLNLNKTQNGVFVFLGKKQELDRQRKVVPIPVLVLLEADDKARIDRLYELGSSKHLFQPVPLYLLLQEIYMLTTES